MGDSNPAEELSTAMEKAVAPALPAERAKEKENVTGLKQYHPALGESAK